jgi:hypothetical protein
MPVETGRETVKPFGSKQKKGVSNFTLRGIEALA